MQGKKAPAKDPEEIGGGGGYLDGLDLPPSSSESESEDELNGRHQPLYTSEDKRQDELKLRVGVTGLRVPAAVLRNGPVWHSRSAQDPACACGKTRAVCGRICQPDERRAAQVGDREKRKLVDKDRKQMEKAHQAKLAALADDDNVFDVAFEQQGDGTEGATLSTTDIKVGGLAAGARPSRQALPAAACLCSAVHP